MILALPLLLGCSTKHRIAVDPVEFKPIHLTMDVNIKLQRELEEFFDFEKTFSAPKQAEADAPDAKGDPR